MIPMAARDLLSNSSQRESGEDGQTMLLIVGYLMLTLLVVTAVVAASSVYLGHKKLLSAADSAASAAAESFTLASIADSTEIPAAVLSTEKVRDVARRYLEEQRIAAKFDRLELADGTGTADSQSATVVLAAVVRLPMAGFFLPDGVRITATSTARAQLHR